MGSASCGQASGRALHPFWARAVLLLAIGLPNCQNQRFATPLENTYHLQVFTTQSSYVIGDSVFVRIVNGDAFPYIWHRCPGVVLQRRTSSDWIDFTSDDTCTPGFITLPGNGTIQIAFVMPTTAPAGRYRVQVSFTVIDTSPPLVWWPSGEFTVSTS